MRSRLKSSRAHPLVIMALSGLLAACATLSQHAREPAVDARSAAAVRAEILHRLPDSVADRQGWAHDIQTALATQHIEAGTAHLCAVLAVVAQESSFNADPEVANLGAIARAEIDRRAGRAHVPGFMVDAALDAHSSAGRTYRQRLADVHTEKQLSALFSDFIGRVPLGRRLFGRFNPVHTGGPMQVSIAFAEAHTDGYPYPVDGTIRDAVFSRRGGLYFGIAHLLGYDPGYPQPIYRFADFNAGRYASRNAAFQKAVARLTQRDLALDGDLVGPGIRPGQTERAVLSLRSRLDMDYGAIRNQLRESEDADFADTPLYRRVFSIADRQAGERVPRAALPQIRLDSPKITRNLTTAWFAQRVNTRWQQCMAGAGG